ncbi:hypothetical protein OAT97_00240 [Gammaproteobacteria bacterium]|nr:hypothetical protein [Gammaproteobacteria bacterium]
MKSVCVTAGCPLYFIKLLPVSTAPGAQTVADLTPPGEGAPSFKVVMLADITVPFVHGMPPFIITLGIVGTIKDVLVIFGQGSIAGAPAGVITLQLSIGATEFITEGRVVSVCGPDIYNSC